MKVDLSAAMNELHSLDWVRSGYSEVRVSIKRDDCGEEVLTWDIYAYPTADGSLYSARWVMGCSSFDESVRELKAALEVKNQRFVE